MMRVRRAAWMAGVPLRLALLGAIKAYRVTLGSLMRGSCRFHPSCSEYAEMAIREVGAARGAVLSAWRLLRCSPLTKGGVDYPPMGWAASGPRRPGYDGVIQTGGPSTHGRGLA
jgi:putative membrane protein insertion efficiency factor